MILDIQDIINCVSVPSLIKDSVVREGHFYKLKNGDIQACVGGFSVVFPVDVHGQKWAFRCWHHTIEEAHNQIKTLSSSLKESGLPYFVDFHYENPGIVINGRPYPTTRMKWIEGLNLKEYICQYRYDRKRLLKLALDFYIMTKDLHLFAFAHGDLQHENILVDCTGKLYLIDYDSMYVPRPRSVRIKNTTNGKEGYQHPCRDKCVYSNPKLDFFSEAIIICSILGIAYQPDLINKYQVEDSDCLLFQKKDFVGFSSSDIYRDLSKLGGPIVIFLNIIQSYLSFNNIELLSSLDIEASNIYSTGSIIDIAKLIVEPRNALNIPVNVICNSELGINSVVHEDIDKEEKAWCIARSSATIDSYQRYLSLYPHGKHYNEAHSRIRSIIDENEWGNAKQIGTVQSYKYYLYRNPLGKHCVEAQSFIDRNNQQNEEKAWNEVCRINSIPSYQNFIKEYPVSKYKVIALKKINEYQEVWDWSQAKSFNTLVSLTEFIRKYPNSIHVSEARSLIEVKKHLIEEQRTWETAHKANTIKSYKSYLDKYPYGRYNSSAKQRIVELNKETKYMIVVLLVIVLFIAAVIVAIL